jgi:general secretion pathway protein G
VSAGWRRRRLIVRGFQGQFVVRQLVWLTAYLLAFAAALLAPLASTLHNGSPDEQFNAAAQFLFFHEYLWPALGGVLVVAAAALIKTSHRIAGPLYRFRRVFGEVTAGNLRANARVRRGDYLALESDALEAMLASLRERIGAAQQAIDAAGHALRIERAAAAGDGHHAVASRGDDTPPPDIESAARAISDAQRILRTFTINANAGFTLIEVLVATAMVDILAAIGVPAYQHALEAARVAKAIGDIKAIDKEVQIKLVLDGCLPGSLKDIGRDRLRDSWGNPYTYHVLPGKAAGGGGGGGGNGGGGGGGNGNGKGGNSGNGGNGNGGQNASGDSCAACNGQCVSIGQARKDRNLVPINSDFDLFSPGRDGKTTGPLTAKTSHDDIVRGSDGAFVGLARDY